jgi:uncharacterized protein YqhQ
VEQGGLERLAVLAFVRAGKETARTVLLNGHFDVVDTDVCGDLAEAAFDADTYTRRVAERDIPAEAREDLATGNWLFGRGVMDMKSGLALHMAYLAHMARQTEKLGVNLFDIVTVIASVLGVALAVLLFLYLPGKCVDLIEWATPIHFVEWQEGLIEGGLKVLIFVLYIWLVSLIPDIKRTFMYHGAEHKSIACYEAGEELTPENAKRYTRFHPRCGTSFMFVMILLGVLIGILLRYLLPTHIVDMKWLYTLIRLALLPIVVGLGFEFIMLAGKHPNWLTRLLSMPGIWMQGITTREPDEDMLEVAITSLKAALPEEFPDFDPTVYEQTAETDAAAAPATEEPTEE